LLNIKAIAKRIIFGYKASAQDYIAYLIKIGVEVGEKIEIFSPRKTTIDVCNPHLLSIGSYVSMTGPVTILTHDYSVSVTKKYTGGEILGKQLETRIGNNVFLGHGCLILPGTIINDNTIIGAMAVVSGVCEGDSVYAGNPAKRICSLQEFYEKRKKRQLDEAVNIYKQYSKRFGVTPPEKLFHEYFYLFHGGNDVLIPEFDKKLSAHQDYNEALVYFRNHVPPFAGYDAFCDYCEKQPEITN